MAVYKEVRAKDIRLFEIALLESKNSLCRYMFGALIARGNRILSIAPNVVKTHPKQMSYHIGCITIHAELHAILRCQNTLGTSLYVARQDKYGNPMISKPCVSCLSYISIAGVREIIYFDKRLVREQL